MKKLAFLTIIATMSCATFPAFAEGVRDYLRAPVVGVWQYETTVRLHADDCTTAPPVPFGLNPFPGLYTFHDGGTLIEHGSRSGPALRSEGHGVWRRIGYRTYETRSIFLRYDANGFYSGTFVTTSELLLAKNGSSFSAVARFAVTDLSGVTQMFCATTDGTRFAL